MGDWTKDFFKDPSGGESEPVGKGQFEGSESGSESEPVGQLGLLAAGARARLEKEKAERIAYEERKEEYKKAERIAKAQREEAERIAKAERIANEQREEAERTAKENRDKRERIAAAKELAKSQGLTTGRTGSQKPPPKKAKKAASNEGDPTSPSQLAQNSAIFYPQYPALQDPEFWQRMEKGGMYDVEPGSPGYWQRAASCGVLAQAPFPPSGVAREKTQGAHPPSYRAASSPPPLTAQQRLKGTGHRSGTEEKRESSHSVLLVSGEVLASQPDAPPADPPKRQPKWSPKDLQSLVR